MQLLILPVSGGGFVAQLAILQHLCEAKYVPDLTLASSGGNVAAYIAAAAEWKWPGIERVARNITQDLFAKQWNSIPIISLIIGYFQGNVYKKGDGVADILLKYFTEKTIGKYEIWTGTYNKTRQKARLFCNRSKDKSIVDISCIDCNLTRSMDPIFANNDIELIAKASVASASIPAIVPSESIGGDCYVDGGVASASPLIIMQDAIINHVKTKKCNLHLIYVNPNDLSANNLLPCNNVVDTWRQAAEDLIIAQTVIDRLSGYQILRAFSDLIHKNSFVCNYKNILIIKKLQQYINYSMLEIYPTKNMDINIVNFTSEDVINAIKKYYSICYCNFWWCQPTDDTHRETIEMLIQSLQVEF